MIDDPKPDRHPAQDWIDQHLEPGNWLRIGPKEDLPAILAGPLMTLAHMFQLAFSPEIERRLQDGLLDESFSLWAAQLIQPGDGSQIVRLNDEMRGVMYARIDRPVEKGEVINRSDLRHVVDFDVVEEELDCGHFTIISDGAGWKMFFNFQSGRAKALGMINRAEEFLEAARYSTERKHLGPAVDNMFSACELLSKARLTLSQSPAAQSKSHGPIGAAINASGRLGNVDASFLKLFNRMSQSRNAARYANSLDVAPPTSEELDLVQREIDLLRRETSHKDHRPPSPEKGDRT